MTAQATAMTSRRSAAGVRRSCSCFPLVVLRRRCCRDDCRNPAPVRMGQAPQRHEEVAGELGYRDDQRGYAESQRHETGRWRIVHAATT